MDRNFFGDESGLELPEYALAAALITLAIVAAFSSVSAHITTVINNLAGYIK
jgi:Flp pilus assembly pilin Flp